MDAQIAYVRVCLDKSLYTTIQSKLLHVQSIPGGNRAIEIIEEEFLSEYLWFTRWCKLFKGKQSDGQKFTAWSTELKKSAAEADLQTLTVDQLLVHLCITGTTDRNLRRKFLELHNPQLNELDHVAQAYEWTQKSMRTTS